MDKGMRRRKNKRRTHRRTLLAILCAVIVLILLNTLIHSLKSGTVTVEIPEGTSSRGISKILKDEDVIGSRAWFLLRLSLSEYNGKLQYGTFKFDRNDSLGEIFEILATKGAKKNTMRLTVPEGFSVEKIKERVVEIGLCTDSEFEEALKKDYDYSFLASVPDDKNIKYRLQGFLFPSTYEFYSDADAETVITTMLDEFEKQIAGLNISADEMYRVITKAAMVEREAKIGSERRTIAGVFENRLKADMPLQIDATVVYAISDGLYDVSRVYYKDLEVDSKYNTYKYKGLPVGPICNPSAASIEAAKNPETHKWLYYHTDTAKNDGSHIFTETYTEHTSSQN